MKLAILLKSGPDSAEAERTLSERVGQENNKTILKNITKPYQIKIDSKKEVILTAYPEKGIS